MLIYPGKVLGLTGPDTEVLNKGAGRRNEDAAVNWAVGVQQAAMPVTPSQRVEFDALINWRRE